MPVSQAWTGPDMCMYVSRCQSTPERQEQDIHVCYQMSANPGEDQRYAYMLAEVSQPWGGAEICMHVSRIYKTVS